jgi:hypothetical protein
MVKAHLKPGGLAVTWAPTDRVLASFVAAFPYSIIVDGIAIGGDQPIAVDPDTILRRLTDPFTDEYYRRIGGDLRPLVSNLISGEFKRHSPDAVRDTRRELNSDLFPRDEYMVPPQR